MTSAGAFILASVGSLLVVTAGAAIFAWLEAHWIHPVRALGEQRRVDREKPTTDPPEHECLTCGVETDEYQRTRWRRDIVAFGIVLVELESGEHYDCLACADDDVTASLRARADDPSDLDHLTPDADDCGEEVAA